MKKLVVVSMILFSFASCAEEMSIEQRVRACDSSLAEDSVALHYHDKDHLNILMMASEVGCFSLVESLVDKIDVNERTRIGTTALFSAVAGANIEIAQLLVKKGVEVSATDNSNVAALFFAVTQGDLQMTKILLDTGANPNRRGKQLGSTPLHFAVIAQRYSLVKLLLEYGADPDIKAKRLGTSLDIAERKKDEKMLKLLQAKRKKRAEPFSYEGIR